jgi:GH18 family chitinase
VDFDWEQPQNKKQMMGYMTLIVETWSAFQNSPLDLLVTVALHPNQFLPSAIYQYVDRVHLMTYDMITPSSQGGYLHHANIDLAKEMLEAFLERGCPRSKLTLGIPAYGRHISDPNQVITFSEVVNANGFEGIDTRNEFNGYLFDSPANVRAKVKWAAENHLAGVFFWEAGQDVIFASRSRERGLIQSAAEEAAILSSQITESDGKSLHGNFE